ncbi:MAG: YceI family protein [Candidatus Korobacteraceae bacterium]
MSSLHKSKSGQHLAALTTLLIALCAAATAQQAHIKLDPAKTRIEWTLGDVLHTVEGTFQLKSGTISFDPRTGEASGQIVVDATSGNSGNGMRDSKMKKDVLESSRYPEIVFYPKHVSGYVAGQESSTVQVAGNFTIHGGTHEITLTMPISVKNTGVEAHTKFAVPYEEWGMKNPSTLFLKVEKTVQISISTVGDLQTSAAAHASN